MFLFDKNIWILLTETSDLFHLLLNSWISSLLIWLIMTKKARIYKRVRIIFSISHVEKTGQRHAKIRLYHFLTPY